MSRTEFLKSLIFPLMGVVTTSSSSGAASAGAVTRLCEHVKARKNLVVDRSKPDIIWTDGAMFEIAPSFPRELQELMSTPTSSRDLHSVITKLSDDTTPDWQDAKPARSSRGERVAVESKDGKITVSLASQYCDYMRERYPNAQIRIKGEFNPVLFKVGGKVRGAIMPVRSGTKGTP
jgi:hypothetical protein